MNTLILLVVAVCGQGPFSTAIDFTVSEPEPGQWTEVSVSDVTIELPIITPKEYERTAPINYKTPVPTKRIPKWCPQRPESRHGYSCGMSSVAEDLLGHLQKSPHNLTLELANKIGRARWQDYHDDMHWYEESDERQEAFLNPKPVKKSGCGPGGCPTSQGYQRRGFFGDGGFF